MHEYEQLGWTPATIGCHWTRGCFSISTYHQGAESGYIIMRAHNEVVRVPTWADVERVCNRRVSERRQHER